MGRSTKTCREARTESSDMKPALPPFKHQKATQKFLSTADRALDLSDPGTGKTRGMIDNFVRIKKLLPSSMLVLAPKSLLDSAWNEDIAKFAPQLTTSIATAKNRAEAFNTPADVYITNFDAVEWLVKQPPKFFKRFNTLVIDEISAFKHRTSKRSKAVNKIKKHFSHRYGLTGTPNPNSITEIWNQAFIIDDGKRLGTSFAQFRNATQEPKQVGPMPNMLEWTDREHAELAVGHLLRDIVIRHKFEECLDIPENHMYSVPYKLSKKQMLAYEQMAKYAYTELDSGRIVSAVNAATVMTKLLQIASGATYSVTGTGTTPLLAAVDDSLGYTPVDFGRYELVADLVEQRAHSIVFFNWRHQKELLIKEFESRGITYVVIDGKTSAKDRKDAVTMFQAGFYKVLLAHPQSAAHGLTLTKGTATIWASPTHNLEHFLQGNRRIYRAGQKFKTETIVVIAPGTIEEKVFQKLQDKNVRQLKLLDLLKDLFSESKSSKKRTP